MHDVSPDVKSLKLWHVKWTKGWHELVPVRWWSVRPCILVCAVDVQYIPWEGDAGEVQCPCYIIHRVASQEGRRAIHPAFQCWSCIGVGATKKSSWHPLIEELLKSEDVPGGIYSSRTLLCWFFFSFPHSPYDAEEAESQLGSPGVVSELPSDMVDMYCTVVLLCILLSGRAYSEPTRRNFVMGVFALHRFMQILCSRLL